MNTVTRSADNFGAREQARDPHPDLPVVRWVVAVSVVATVAVTTIAYFGGVAIDQIAPAAIATIGGITLAAITAIGVVLRRRGSSSRRR